MSSSNPSNASKPSKTQSYLARHIQPSFTQWQHSLLGEALQALPPQQQPLLEELAKKSPHYHTLLEAWEKAFFDRLPELGFEFVQPCATALKVKYGGRPSESFLQDLREEVSEAKREEFRQDTREMLELAVLVSQKAPGDPFEWLRRINDILKKGYIQRASVFLRDEYLIQEQQTEGLSEQKQENPIISEEVDKETETGSNTQKKGKKPVVRPKIFTDDYCPAPGEPFSCETTLSFPYLMMDYPLPTQIFLFTMLSKCAFWPKIVRATVSKHGKGTGIEFMAEWFRAFKSRFDRFILSETDFSSQGMRQLKSMKEKMAVKIDENQAIFTAVQNGNLDDVRQNLLKGVDVNCRNPKDKYKGLLHYAASCKNLEIMEMLRPFNPDINLGDETGMSPLFYAIETNDLNCVQKIIDMGADVNHQDDVTSTPIYWGVYVASLDILKLLKKAGSKMHVENRLNRTPLLKAAFMNKTDVVRWLLESEEIVACINTQDDRGRTALHCACWGSSGGRHGKYINQELLTDSPGSLMALLDQGADVR